MLLIPKIIYMEGMGRYKVGAVSFYDPYSSLSRLETQLKFCIFQYNMKSIINCASTGYIYMSKKESASTPDASKCASRGIYLS